MAKDLLHALVAVLLLCFGLAGCDDPATTSAPPLTEAVAIDYIGSAACAGCHQEAWQHWQQSHHQLAMAPADASTVLADFADAQLRFGTRTSRFQTRGTNYVVSLPHEPAGLQEVTVRYTFGVAPLQQYLVETDKGRLQALPMVWDSRDTPVASGEVPHQGGWFHLNPHVQASDDPEHWSRGGQNWNHMCADCHSTAVHKNYSPADDTFATEFAEVSVGCEACHGPGSAHAAQPQRVALPTLAAPKDQLNACARCHSRRSQLAEGFTPAHNYLDYYVPALLDPGLYHPDGQINDEVFVYGSFMQSKMQRAGVTCTNCHEPHSAKLKVSGNAVCTQCHNPAGRPEFPSLVAARYDSSDHHFHPPASQGARCVSCHMPQKVYMGIDGRRDHSFRVPRPDLSQLTGAPDACTSCHSTESPQWAAAAIAAHTGKTKARDADATPHYGVVFALARDGQLAAEPGLVAIALDPSQAAIVRATALSLMAGYQRQNSAAALVQGLNSESALQRIGAIRGAARWSFAERWRRLRRLLGDEVLAVRTEATLALMPGLNQLPATQQSALRSAVNEYIATQTLHLDRPSARTNLAGVHLHMGDVNAAEQQLQQALELNPDWVPGMVNLADLYRATGRDELAGSLLATALERVPENAEVLVAKALWLVRQGQRQAGAQMLERAYASQPDQSVAYLYAAALHSTDRSAQALEVVDAVMASGRRYEQMLELGLGIAQALGDSARMEHYRRGVIAPSL